MTRNMLPCYNTQVSMIVVDGLVPYGTRASTTIMMPLERPGVMYLKMIIERLFYEI